MKIKTLYTNKIIILPKALSDVIESLNLSVKIWVNPDSNFDYHIHTPNKLNYKNIYEYSYLA